MSEIGYCTPDDVRRVMQDASFSGALDEDDNQAVVNAIAAQAEWLQETTNRHWFVADPGEDESLLPTDPLTHSHDELDVPSSPHADNAQMQTAAWRQRRYPVRHAGPYTRVKLTRRDIVDVTELLIRDSTGGVTDWVETKTEGRGDDYYVQSADHSGTSYLYLHTGALPRLRDYDNAVVVTYEYGIEGLTRTVRQAVAMRATAHLLAPDDDAALGIPDNGNLVAQESKVKALERQAEELLEIHL